MENSHVYEPLSYVIYYVDHKSKAKCVIAGNHRIAAKKVVQTRYTQNPQFFETAPDLSLSVIKVSSDIDAWTVLNASAGM